VISLLVAGLVFECIGSLEVGPVSGIFLLLFYKKEQNTCFALVIRPAKIRKVSTTVDGGPIIFFPPILEMICPFASVGDASFPKETILFFGGGGFNKCE
jgi:hypothetical protein